MGIEDRVDLVGSLRRLVDALTESGDDARRADPQVEERREVGFGETATRSRGRAIGRDLARLLERLFEPRRMRFDISAVEGLAVGHLHEKAAEQDHIRAGRDRQMQI